MSLFCTTDTSGSNYSSWSSNFTYSFKDVIDATNETLEFRDFGKPFVLYKISNDFLFVLANLKMNTYYFVKLKVEFDKAKRVVQEYITTTKAIKFQGKTIASFIHDVTKICVGLNNIHRCEFLSILNLINYCLKKQDRKYFRLKI